MAQQTRANPPWAALIRQRSNMHPWPFGNWLSQTHRRQPFLGHHRTFFCPFRGNLWGSRSLNAPLAFPSRPVGSGRVPSTSPGRPLVRTVLQCTLKAQRRRGRCVHMAHPNQQTEPSPASNARSTCSMIESARVACPMNAWHDERMNLVASCPHLAPTIARASHMGLLLLCVVL